MRYAILVDNQPHAPECESEHGLAIWIEHDGANILFDTGQSDMLIRNADRLAIPLRKTDVLVLSHGHYDHTGGLAHLDAALPPETRIISHPDVMRARFSRHADGSVHAIGLPPASRRILEKRQDHIEWVTGPTEMLSGLWVTGEIPRRTDFEDTGGDFRLDEACTKVDTIPDDMALWVDTPEELRLFTGCAHAGVINTIRHVRDVAGGQSIQSLVGGFHLKHASPTRLRKTAAALEALAIPECRPLHCTGDVSPLPPARCDFT